MRRRAFAARDFEYLQGSATDALLRLSGRWRGGRPVAGDCLLRVTTGTATERFEALPAPPVDKDPWRVAYPVPLDLVTREDARFALEAPGHEPVRLPRPAERATGDARPAGNAVSRAQLRRQLGAARRDAVALREQLERSRRARSEAESDAQRERRRSEERLGLAASARTRADELAETLERTEAELHAARERNARLEAVLARLREGVDEAGRKLGAVESRAQALRAVLAEVLRSSPAAGAEIDRRRLAVLSEEVERRGARLAQLERAALGLQAAIHARLDSAAEHQADEPVAEVHPLPVGVA
jgi:predicted  nucleic acid-binding Zn-ribbon protein